MKVEVLIAFGPWSKGKIIPDMAPNQAADLIRRNLVREVRAVEGSPIDRMLRARVKKRA